ncbi:type II toxin-antitoxin system VapC family toxin [Deferrisoma palaeochoriense]
MILYCDTSAVVKCFIREPASAEIREAVAAAKFVATSEVAWAETLAALARRAREGDLDEGKHGLVRRRFMRAFSAWARVPLGEEVNERVARLVLEHPLRGFDAIHLASALLIQEQARSAVTFACYDERLSRCAASAGLRLFS